MAIHGSLTSMSVPDLFQFLANGRKTGNLKFGRAKVIKHIYFENGIIVGSFSNDPKEYLGQVLIHYGKLDEPRLRVAMEAQRQTGVRLGEVLVTQGLLTPADVLEILRTRTLDIIYDLFLWDEAQFEFFDDEPFPEDLIRIAVQPTSVVMEGIYRVDEWARYRTLIPSDRSILHLGTGWTSALSFGKEVRQILSFVEKQMSVAEICYNMHASAFKVYAQLYELVRDGIAVVAGEVPESPGTGTEKAGLPRTIAELLVAASAEHEAGRAGTALPLIHEILEREPKNSEAQALLLLAEKEFIQQIYAADFSPQGVPTILMTPDNLPLDGIGSQEGFVLSRINGEWDIESILSICPFREADTLRMIKTLLDKGIIGF
jgi:hypothetical protein